MIGDGGFAVEAELPVATVTEREQLPVVRHQRRVVVSAAHKGELPFHTFDRYHPGAGGKVPNISRLGTSHPMDLRPP